MWNLVRMMFVLVAYVSPCWLQRSGADGINVVATHPIQRIDELVMIIGFVRSGALQEVEHFWNVMRWTQAQHEMHVVTKGVLLQ